MAGRDVVWPGDAQFTVQHSAGWQLPTNGQRQNRDVWLEVHAETQL